MAITYSYALSPVKSEFSLNGLVAGNQFGSEVIALENGGFAVAYGTASGIDRSLSVNFFDSNFNPIVTQSGAYTVPYVGSASGVEMLGSPQLVEMAGNLVGVFWASTSDFPGSEESHYSTIKYDNGQVVSAQVLFNNSSQFDDMDVLQLGGGGLAIAYNGYGYSNLEISIRTDVGDPVVIYNVVTPFAYNVSDMAAATLSSGGSVVFYVVEGITNALRYDVRLPNGASAFTGQFASGSSNQIVGQITAAGFGQDGFAVAYANAASGITLWMVPGGTGGGGATGPITVDVNLAAVEKDIRLTAVGDKILVTWTELNASGSGDILARLFDSSGNPLQVGDSNDPFVVAAGVSNQTEVSVAHLLSGELVFTWTDSTGDGTGAGIRGKIIELTNHITGDSSANVLQGDNGMNILIGLQGSDRLDGGLNQDQMFGGLGNDTYFVDHEQDTVSEAANQGLDTINSSVSWQLAENFERLNLVGAEDIDGYGTMGSDRITGNSGDNLLVGAGGNDTLDGGSGFDLLYGGSGHNRLSGGAGNDFMATLEGEDQLFGSAGNDTLKSGAGNDLLDGGNEDDRLIGGSGNDVQNGGTGMDRMDGGTDDDLLLGGIGNEILNGDSGDDEIQGGLGKDILTGGAGADTFTYMTVAECGLGKMRDVITDFQIGDVISLSAIDAIEGSSGNVTNDAFTFIGGAQFSAAGQLRFVSGVLSADVDGNGVADFQIELTGVDTLDWDWLIA